MSSDWVLELRVTTLVLFDVNGMRIFGVSDKDFASLADFAGIRDGFFIRFSLSSFKDI